MQCIPWIETDTLPIGSRWGGDSLLQLVVVREQHHPRRVEVESSNRTEVWYPFATSLNERNRVGERGEMLKHPLSNDPLPFSVSLVVSSVSLLIVPSLLYVPSGQEPSYSSTADRVRYCRTKVGRCVMQKAVRQAEKRKSGAFSHLKLFPAA